ncbi:monomeric archaeal DNA polymerase sliding clamp [Archaeoglobus sulfaticallidus PM70-1]|uniref:DNA polymerase sliding clamp n=2 Tax=Archaeoglobus TaxID=2233 RepID=N0BH36_9EURY|nr:monomeric archaeal DNA polymerase sliding clamp [Archaeoglobus sulfaticallidus PM70-1]
MVDVVLNGEILKTVSKAMVSLVSEARFHFKEEGLHSRAVDPANVAMVIVDVPSSSFIKYESEGDFVAGVDVNRIFDISKSIKNDDVVEMTINEESFIVKFGSVKYSVSLIDPSAIRKEPRIPQIDLPAKIVMDAGEFKKAIVAADKISDHVVFRTNEEGFFIEAEGDVDRITFSLSDAELAEFNRQEAKSMFSLEYLKEFVKIASSGDVLTIRLGNDYPVRMVFEVAGGKVRVEYILAPRIEAE